MLPLYFAATGEGFHLAMGIMILVILLVVLIPLVPRR